MTFEQFQASRKPMAADAYATLFDVDVPESNHHIVFCYASGLYIAFGEWGGFYTRTADRAHSSKSLHELEQWLYDTHKEQINRTEQIGETRALLPHITALVDVAARLGDAWQLYDNTETICAAYPFEEDFDTVLLKLREWMIYHKEVLEQLEKQSA